MSLFHDEEEAGGGEPVPGLPSDLPEGERVLWQGSPNALAFGRDVFHPRFVLAYVVVVAGLRIAPLVSTGTLSAETIAAPLVSALVTVAGAVLILGILAWAMSRSTIYTLTNKRLVLRYGVAIRKYVNVPFTIVTSASVKPGANGHGNIALALAKEQNIGFLRLWPHARPFRFMSPEPALRGIANVQDVAGQLAAAMQANNADVQLAPSVSVETKKSRAVDHLSGTSMAGARRAVDQGAIGAAT